MRTLLWMLTLMLALAGCKRQAQPMNISRTTPIATVALTASPTFASTVAPRPEAEAQAVYYRVCTGYERGALNVRACPGTECAVRFILAESMEVVPAGERVRVGESTWVRLAGPVQGWVNGRYLCREGAK